MNNYLFCGSRGIDDSNRFRTACNIIRHELNKLNFVNDQIIHGGAIGIDTLVDKFARERGFMPRVFHPNYRLHGREAPLVRDREMVALAGQVIAIWDGSSTGTRYTVNYAVSQAVKTHVYVLKPKSKAYIVENVRLD